MVVLICCESRCIEAALNCSCCDFLTIFYCAKMSRLRQRCNERIELTKCDIFQRKAFKCAWHADARAHDRTQFSMFTQYKIGITREGRLLAADCKIYLNGGFSIDDSILVRLMQTIPGLCAMWIRLWDPLVLKVLSATVKKADTCCDVPNMRVQGWARKRNLPSNTAFRGFGQPQSQMIMETIMAHISETVGQPLEKVRPLLVLLCCLLANCK